MKQIDECLDRLFLRQKPLKKKWRAFVEFNDDGEEILILYHYHHLIFVFNLTQKREIYLWYEKDADKRGLISAINYLCKKEFIQLKRRNIINIYNILVNTTNKYCASIFVRDLVYNMEGYSRG